MKTNLCRRVSILALCAVFVFCLACPAFAAPAVDLDYQYVFTADFTLADISLAFDSWYSIPFDLSGLADKVYADYVIFSIDDMSYECKFREVKQGPTFHFIGNGSSVLGADAGEDVPFCLCICVDDSSLSRLYLHLDLVGPVFHGNKEAVHVAVSVAYNQPMTTSSLMDDTSSVFGSAIGMVGTVVKTVASNPILYLPIVIGLCGIGVGFFRRLKQ